MKHFMVGIRLMVCIGVAVCGAHAVYGAGETLTMADCSWEFFGGQGDARAAESIAGAGDVNGDGYGDLIVGARFFDSGSTDSGIAWVFYGGESGFSATPDVTLTPPVVQSSGFFGMHVASAGDVNGDGYDDVMVGMMNWDQPSPFFHDEGAVFVYHGGAAGLDATYDWMCHAGVQWAHLGWGMGPAGDVNGDGYDDIIVGGYDYTNYWFEAAMVFHGSTNGLDPDGSRPQGTPANADWVVVTDQAGASFGIRVGTAGDVNGDGYDDVFVGAPFFDNGEVDEGVLFVWYGSAAGLGPNTSSSSADWKAESNQAEAYLSGPSETANVGCAGDVNDDGYDDLIVGSFYYDIDGENTGIALVYYGSDVGLGADGTPANADWMASGENEGDILGGTVGGAGDINGDGIDDVVIGAPSWDDPTSGITNAGLTAIYYGGEDGLCRDGQPHWSDVMVIGDQESALFGRTLAATGDIDGDGMDDLVIGSFYYDDTATNEGAAFAFFGEPITFIDDFETGDTLRWSGEVD